MSSFGTFLSYAVTAVFAQNLVLAGGIGASRLIRAARQPKQLFAYSAAVGIFTLIASVITYPVSLPIRGTGAEVYLCPLIFALCVTGVYFGARIILMRFFEGVYQKISHSLNQCAFNGIVMGTPVIAAEKGFGFFQTFGFAVGSAVGFLLAAFLVSEGLRRIDNAEIPRAFRGVPAGLLYIGMLSLAFAGFSGESPFMF